MATYNGSRFLREQLSSILVQLGPDDEIIISDDGSKDDTVNVIKQFSDDRIRLIINFKRHGVIGNFENAIQQAKGDYVFLSDQDDIWHPNKVSTCVPLLKKNILVVHNAKIIDGEGKPDGINFFELRGSKEGYWNNIWRNSYLGCCMCFRAELLQYLLPFPKKIEMHDRWIGLISQMYGIVFYETECLLSYRVHGNNVSNSTGKSTNSLWEMFKIRYWLLYYTTIRYLSNKFKKVSL